MFQTRTRAHAGWGGWLLAASAVTFAVLIGTGIGGSRFTVHFDDLATAGAALAAAVLCVRAASRHVGKMRQFWALLALATTAWAAGEGIWAAYDLSAGSVPTSSWADVAYLAAVPPTVAALLVHPAGHGRATERTRSVFDAVIVATSLFFVGWTLLFAPVRHSIHLTSRDGAVTLAYPFSDIVIVFLVVLVVRGTTRGGRRDLWWLLAGLVLITCSDSVYFYLSNVRHFATGNLVDTGWFAGYLAVGLAAFHATVAVRVPSPRETPAFTSAALVAPFVPMLGALFILTLELELGHALDPTMVVSAFVLVGLVLLRQALLVTGLVRAREAPAG
ncbi:MAG: hypothetical protein ACXVRJ_02885 [Gaiellaceae bacterium]